MEIYEQNSTKKSPVLDVLLNVGLTVDEVDQLLRIETSNSYGIMAKTGSQGARNIRGSGFYAAASLLNHDCLPNLARFDRFDVQPPSGHPGETQISFRALHDIPAGEELTTSYFPLTVPFQERQQRCLEMYGFDCRCARCLEESTWSSDEDSAEDARSDSGGMELEAAPADVKEHREENVDAAYVQVFLLKYVCSKEDCLGTMAPVEASDAYECNLCANLRSESDLARELEEYCG